MVQAISGADTETQVSLNTTPHSRSCSSLDFGDFGGERVNWGGQGKSPGPSLSIALAAELCFQSQIEAPANLPAAESRSRRKKSRSI